MQALGLRDIFKGDVDLNPGSSEVTASPASPPSPHGPLLPSLLPSPSPAPHWLFPSLPDILGTSRQLLRMALCDSPGKWGDRVRWQRDGGSGLRRTHLPHRPLPLRRE